MRIVTERLILRDLEMKDAKDLLNNINNLNVSKNLVIISYPYTLKKEKRFIKECIEKRKKKKRKAYTLGIELKSSGELIGVISLRDIDRFQGTAEVGYWLGEKYWRKGFMGETLKVILEFGFSKLKLRRVEAFVFDKNIASEKLLKKFGFKFEGLKRRGYRSNASGKIHDGKLYGLLKKEFKK